MSRVLACTPRTRFATLRSGSYVHVIDRAQFMWRPLMWTRPTLQVVPACRPHASLTAQCRAALAAKDARVTCRACVLIEHARSLGAIHKGAPYTYYALRPSDGLIKIGVSVRPGLRCYGLGLDLLAVELSVSTASETARHDLFKEQRRDGEFFEPTAELMAHIASLAETQGNSLRSVGHTLVKERWFPGREDVDQFIVEGHAEWGAVLS